MYGMIQVSINWERQIAFAMAVLGFVQGTSSLCVQWHAVVCAVLGPTKEEQSVESRRISWRSV